MMLDQLLHLQLDHGTIHALRWYISLHESAVVAPGNPGIGVYVVLHASNVLTRVVAVSSWDGVHIVAQGVHDIRLGGADAHESATFAILSHL